jgi:hypothetical protein
MLYRSKESGTESSINADPKKDKKGADNAGKKEEKKKEEKKGAKKKTIGSVLENYNLVHTEEKRMAKFKLQLTALLDGVTKEVKRVYTEPVAKVQLPPSALNEEKRAGTKLKSANSDKKKASIDKGINSTLVTPMTGKDAKKKPAEAQDQLVQLQPVEPPPIEFSIAVEIFDFANYDALKNYNSS